MRLLIIMIALMPSCYMMAAEASIEFLYTSKYDENKTLVLGISDMAQDTFDVMDQIVPPFVPPGGEQIMPVTFLNNGIYEDGEVNEESVDVDIRYGEVGFEITKSYKVTTLGAYDQVPWTVRWGTPPEDLVSGVLRDDNYLGSGKFLFEADIMTESELIVTSPISKWEYVLTWKLTPTSIVEKQDLDGQQSPFDLVGTTLLYHSPAQVEIYDMQGAKVLVTRDESIRTENLNKGVYIIVSEIGGKKYIDKYIR